MVNSRCPNHPAGRVDHGSRSQRTHLCSRWLTPHRPASREAATLALQKWGRGARRGQDCAWCPQHFGPEQVSASEECQAILPPFLRWYRTHIPWVEVTERSKVPPANGSNWHELVIQANTCGWRPSPQEGSGTEATHSSGSCGLVCGRTSPPGCQPAASLPIKVTVGKTHDRLPSRRHSLWASDFRGRRGPLVSRLRVLGMRPAVQLKDARELSLTAWSCCSLPL